MPSRGGTRASTSFAAATGIRESELIALGWPDLRDGFVIVRLGKGRKQHTTTITRRYAHLSPSYQRNEMLKMSSFWRAGTRRGHGPANIAKD